MAKEDIERKRKINLVISSHGYRGHEWQKLPLTHPISSLIVNAGRIFRADQRWKLDKVFAETWAFDPQRMTVADGIFIRTDLARARLPSRPTTDTILSCRNLLRAVLQEELYSCLELIFDEPPNSPMNINYGTVKLALKKPEESYLKDFSIPPYRTLALSIEHGSFSNRRGWFILPDVAILSMIIEHRPSLALQGLTLRSY